MKLSLLGVPSSIGARNPGVEKAPDALRRAGLVEKLRAGGHEVVDQGDQQQVTYAPDPDPSERKHQNRERVAAVSRTLASRVQSVLQAGRVPLILGGDCTIAVGTLSGATRVHADPGLIYLDRDADLNTPSTTPSGILDGMVVAHLLGRGLPELARLGERFPLLRPGKLALLGVERLDPPEVPIYEALPSYRLHATEIRKEGPEGVAEEVLKRLAGEGEAFFVHFDIDVVDGADLPGTDIPQKGGLPLEAAGRLLSRLAASPSFAGLEVTEFNPARDPDGATASRLVDLLVEALGGGNRKP